MCMLILLAELAQPPLERVPGANYHAGETHWKEFLELAIYQVRHTGKSSWS